MRYRLQEGNGKAIYVIGVLDSGIVYGLSALQKNRAIKVFKKMCYKNSATISILLDCYYNNKNFIIIHVNAIKYCEHNLNYLTF